MVLKITNFVRKEERIRHELVVDREKPLEAANNNTEYVFLRKVVHQGVSIENALAHLYYVQIMVAEGHTVPHHRAVARLSRLSVSVFANNVLESV